MDAFIKSRANFHTVSSASVVSWDTPLASIDNDSGTVVLVGSQAARGAEGDFLVMDGHVWLIEEIAFDNGLASVKVCPVARLFDRSLVYSAPASGTTVEDWIRTQIESQYKNCSDFAYAIPYLTVTVSGSTAWAAPDVDDNGLYVLEDYLQTVHNLYGIRLTASVDGNRLLLSITKQARSNHRIVFTDGQTQLITETYSRKSVAKITTIQAGVITDWYLSADGAISNSPPAQRAEGLWKVLTLKERDVPAEKVAAKFGKNSRSHKIEFMSARLYSLYDNVQLRLGDTVVESYISYVGVQSGDKRRHYKTGELKTTLTQVLKGVIQNERNTGNHLR